MVVLKRGRILKSWSSLLVGCNGEEEGFFRRVEQNLEGLKPPDVGWKRESVSTGMWEGMVSGKRRDYIILNHEKLKDYMLCIGARDYGRSLDVCWYLTLPTKSLFMMVLQRIPFFGAFVTIAARFLGINKDLDIFDEQDLSAYLASAQFAVKATIQDLLKAREVEMQIDWGVKEHLEAA